MQRYAAVRGHSCTGERVSAYLPSGYKVIWEGIDESCPFKDHTVVIQGEDWSGWTLDGYVIPRLGSGGMAAREIDLSHPIMKQIPI